ncbi:MAG: hypothetical protein N4A49_13765 [Marinifilaceae bacterium]|jgi:hypothetical protein|nr:hypothetical protein [Marinifilaceae bacterium]
MDNLNFIILFLILLSNSFIVIYFTKIKIELRKKVRFLEKYQDHNSKSFLEKREEFLKINSFFTKLLCEKKSKNNFKRIQKEFLDMGTRLYYYASENTILKFLEFKSLGIYIDGNNSEHKVALLWFAEFNMLLRKDLGFSTTPELIKAYLNIILSYWDSEEMEDAELKQLKEQLSESVDNYFSVFNVGTSMN